jgi:hypothetical protein
MVGRSLLALWAVKLYEVIIKVLETLSQRSRLLKISLLIMLKGSSLLMAE